MSRISGLVAADVGLFGIVEFRLIPLGVLCDVDHHGSGSAGPGDVKGFFDGYRQFSDILDQVVVFGDGSGDPRYVRLLESIVADEMRIDLASDGHDWDRVHIRGC